MATEIQRERNRGYFVESAKRLVLALGAEHVSVRDIAKDAGFSYATVYNYFTDLNHLLWHVMMSCIRDVISLLDIPLASEYYTLNDLKLIYGMYVEYFLENPNAFRLIFFSDVGETPDELSGTIGSPDLARRLVTRLKDESCKTIDDGEIPVLAEIIRSSIQGMLALHLSGKSDTSPEALTAGIDRMLEYLLQK